MNALFIVQQIVCEDLTAIKSACERRNYMVAADRLHATLNLSLSIHLRGWYPLVELELFHQELMRRHLTHFRYLHRILNHHRINAYVRSVPFLRRKTSRQPEVTQFVFLSFSQKHANTMLR